MADARVAESMSKQGGFGITEMVLKQFRGPAAKAEGGAAVDPGK